ncbi:cytochrome c family protein [Polymorphobacter glacialis]|uniref:Cytochrome c family protein n=1 Tax=Sandarakinorhabdus glacialis TaxID=1614636 RepID=A0A917EBC0_9SPHN|nr:cytochrome c family protein [Polymorphobacter glacialis]GGE19793.1 cytochrome c family protein [Polymorphobacter glacialis]
MDSFEFNKFAGWALAALSSLLAISIVVGEVFTPHLPEKAGYVVAGVVEEGPVVAAGEVEKPIAFYLASATAEQGAAVFKKCAACHNAEKGGPSGIGPNLYGVVGGPHAHAPGFSYSEVLSGMKAKPWTFDDLSAWLKSPKAYAPGNKMAFAGISKPQDRAAVILYLNSKADAPKPLPPVPAEAPVVAAAAPAAGAPAAAPAPATTAPAAAAPTPVA